MSLCASSFSPVAEHRAAFHHFTDAPRLILGDFPVQTALSDPPPPPPPPLPHPSLRLSLHRYHTNEHAACGSHSLASQILDIISPEQCRSKQRLHQLWLDGGFLLIGIGERERPQTLSPTQGKGSTLLCDVILLQTCNTRSTLVFVLRGRVMIICMWWCD